MYYFNYKDELYHYGKKGMRWGIRKKKSDYKINKNNKNQKKARFGRSKAGDSIKAFMNGSTKTNSANSPSASSKDIFSHVNIESARSLNSINRGVPFSKVQQKNNPNEMSKPQYKNKPDETANASNAAKAAYARDRYEDSYKSKDPVKTHKKPSTKNRPSNNATSNRSKPSKQKGHKTGHGGGKHF